MVADGDGKNSPFTKALLQHIDTPEDIAVVLRKIRDQVMRDTDGKQQPWDYNSLTGGSLILSAISASFAGINETSAPSKESDAETALWAMVSSGKELEGIRLYLARHPNGKFSEVAKALLKEEDRLAAKALAEKRERERALLAAETAPLKVAFAYVGPVGDGGWTYAHDRARAAVQAEFGDKL